jgi:3-dehydro-L-gulonate 2-dehydrogenase
MRVPFDEIHDTLRRALVATGMEADRADLSARLFAEASRDGVSSHGLNRFPRFMRMIRRGVVDVHARPEPVAAHSALERWDGRGGPGNLNAHAMMTRTIALATAHGAGCVALANTNHWMRGGSYGWQAADAGVIGICWTNTLANLPPWGAANPRIGNNPLIVAVPRRAGHVVLDMAMSQFSVGALASYQSRGELLPVPGGYDAAGALSRDPAAVEASGRLLPAGFWKGSVLSLMLDLVAMLLRRARHPRNPAGARARNRPVAGLPRDRSIDPRPRSGRRGRRRPRALPRRGGGRAVPRGAGARDAADQPAGRSSRRPGHLGDGESGRLVNLEIWKCGDLEI